MFVLLVAVLALAVSADEPALAALLKALDLRGYTSRPAPPQFSGRTLDTWAYAHGVQLRFIRPGNPPENAFVETFNGKAEKFVDDKEADKLLTREYRKGFEIPSSFGSSSTHDQAARR